MAEFTAAAVANTVKHATFRIFIPVSAAREYGPIPVAGGVGNLGAQRDTMIAGKNARYWLELQPNTFLVPETTHLLWRL
jgi:hypothetical protein